MEGLEGRQMFFIFNVKCLQPLSLLKINEQDEGKSANAEKKYNSYPVL